MIKHILVYFILIIGCLVLSTENTYTQNYPAISPVLGLFAKNIVLGFGVEGTVGDSIRKPHNGVDFSVREGTEIIATADGRVALAKTSTGHYGTYIKLNHGNGYESFYAHLSKISVEEGDSVRTGSIIGYSGKTGLVDVPTLHYEVRINGIRVNPEDYIPRSVEGSLPETQDVVTD